MGPGFGPDRLNDGNKSAPLVQEETLSLQLLHLLRPFLPLEHTVLIRAPKVLLIRGSITLRQE